MNLLVVDSQQPAVSLDDLVAGTQSTVDHVPDAVTARSQCALGIAELVVVTEAPVAQELASGYPNVAVVLQTEEPLEEADLLALMRCGVADVWRSDIDQEGLLQRLHVLATRRARADELSSERLDRRYKELAQDQQAGRLVQRKLLPATPWQAAGLHCEHRLQASQILSGDFVDYFTLDERYVVAFIADVSGHGASSAFVTVLLKDFSRRLRRYYAVNPTEPHEMLSWLNGELHAHNMGKHVAILLMRFDTVEHKLDLANGGHYPQPLLKHGASLDWVRVKGKPTGLFPQAEYQQVSVNFEPGDHLIACTDGLIEALPAKGAQQQAQYFRDLAAESQNLEHFWSRVETLSVERHDDASCLWVECCR